MIYTPFQSASISEGIDRRVIRRIDTAAVIYANFSGCLHGVALIFMSFIAIRTILKQAVGSYL